jgi:hypothetical protein
LILDAYDLFIARFSLDVNKAGFFDFVDFAKKPKLLRRGIPIDIHAKH